jgi:hypothetical protein
MGNTPSQGLAPFVPIATENRIGTVYARPPPNPAARFEVLPSAKSDTRMYARSSRKGVVYVVKGTAHRTHQGMHAVAAMPPTALNVSDSLILPEAGSNPPAVSIHAEPRDSIDVVGFHSQLVQEDATAAVSDVTESNVPTFKPVDAEPSTASPPGDLVASTFAQQTIGVNSFHTQLPQADTTAAASDMKTDVKNESSS